MVYGTARKQKNVAEFPRALAVHARHVGEPTGEKSVNSDLRHGGIRSAERP